MRCFSHNAYRFNFYSMKKYILFLLVSTSFIHGFAQRGFSWQHRQLAMGTDTAEIYLCTYWFPHEYDSIYETILHSSNNGLSFSIRNDEFIYTLPGPPSAIYSDSASGVVYKCPDHSADTFSVSLDTGLTLIKKYFHLPTNPASGCLPGEIYFQTYLSGPVLCRSTNYGSSFDTIDIPGSMDILDVGVNPGELFFFGYDNPVDTVINIVTSLDFGFTYQSHKIYVPYYNNCHLRHGTSTGEFYLMVYDTPGEEHFRLYHATDYGNTVTYQQTFEGCGGFFTSYTAGRKPGTLYVARRSTYDPYLYIDYSTDYGVTFTTYTHYLDSTYTGIPQKQIRDKISIFPNPASDRINITIHSSLGKQKVELLNLYGQLYAKADIPESCDRITILTGTLPRGLYILRVISGQGRVTAKKLLLN